MGYYKDNNFGSNYISFYQQQIQDLWKNEYNTSTQLNPELVPEQPSKESNTLTAHILKKRKSVRSIDELSNYLSSSQADYNVNILEYWKVNLLNY